MTTLSTGALGRLLTGLLVFTFLSCASTSRWRASDAPGPEQAALLLADRGVSELVRHIQPEEIVEIPIRRNLRPCCAFGADLSSRVGPIPIPFYRIPNVLGPHDLGKHTYDAGVLQVRYGAGARVGLSEERNGLVYTCRGGFIDTAHVRDYVDWTFYLAHEIASHLVTGGTIDLGDEGGRRLLVVRAVERELIERVGIRRLTAWLARWAGFQLSVWHEIATAYGWAAVPGFSELASAFSPEDLYSNLVGAKMTAAVIHRRGGRSEKLYNESVAAWLEAVLESLGAVDAEVGRSAVAAVDGLWWDSKVRLPDPRLVIRRNLEIGERIEPWLVPEGLAPPSLREACGAEPKPEALANPARIDGIEFSQWVTLEIEIADGLVMRDPFDRIGKAVTQEDFPAIVAVLRQRVRAKLGARADQRE